MESINSNFALPLHYRLKHSIDIIIFNPPYVPTVTDEAREAQHNRDIQGSWAGGSDGMDVTNQFLDLVGVWDFHWSIWGDLILYQELMSPRARLYLVAVMENDILNIRRRMSDNHGLESEVCSSFVSYFSFRPNMSRSFFAVEQAANICS